MAGPLRVAIGAGIGSAVGATGGFVVGHQIAASTNFKGETMPLALVLSPVVGGVVGAAAGAGSVFFFSDDIKPLTPAVAAGGALLLAVPGAASGVANPPEGDGPFKDGAFPARSRASASSSAPSRALKEPLPYIAP